MATLYAPQRSSGAALWSVQRGDVAPAITAVTASNITQTGATITVTRSNPAAGTLYLALYPTGITPTWSIGAGWSGTPVYTDADTDPGTGSTYQFVPDASGLTAGTQYVPWAVWDDGVTTVGPTQGTTFETLAAGISGTLSATESGADTFVASGALIVAGALVVTESGADTITASGAVIVAGQIGATETGADTAAISGGSQISGTLAAQEAGADTVAIGGSVIVSGTLSASETGADDAIIVGGNILAGYMAAQEAGSDTAAASGSIGAADVIGNFSALESGADTISVSGVVVVSGSMAAVESGGDTMQTDNGEWYPSSRTITVPSGRTITLRPR